MLDKTQLLKLLCDGHFHSGEDLGRLLGVSRAAVWKVLKDLKSYGIELQTVRGRGYKLARPLSLLDKLCIEAELGESARELLASLDIHFEIDSTNSYLMRQAQTNGQSGSVCLAEYQSGGRGRRGRTWVSPLGSNIYLSLLWRFPDGAARLSGLSLSVAVALVQALEELGAYDLYIKWPNDILWQGRKLAGILLEVAGESAGPCHVVCGIGLNVNMPGEAAQAIDQAWTDLSMVGISDVTRNQITSVVLRHLLFAMHRYEAEGFAPFHKQWQQYDATYNRPVLLQLYNRVQKGMGRGVDNRGLLLIENSDGIQSFASGEVSLRLQDNVQ